MPVALGERQAAAPPATGVLVPAVMKLTGRASWWAPRPLARFTIRD